MIIIAVYDGVEIMPQDGYPDKIMHRFSKVWEYDINGNATERHNVLAYDGQRIKKKFKLQQNRIYLLKAREIEDNIIKSPYQLDRCEIIDYYNNSYRIITSPCQGIFIKGQYKEESLKINNFFKVQFQTTNVGDFTKYVLKKFSKENNLDIHNTVMQLSIFNTDNYYGKIKKKAFKSKPEEKVNTEVMQSSIFDHIDDDFVNPNENTNKQEENNKASVTRKNWTAEEDKIITINRHLFNDLELAQMVNRTNNAVKNRIHKLRRDGEITDRGLVRRTKDHPLSDSNKKKFRARAKSVRKKLGFSFELLSEIVGIPKNRLIELDSNYNLPTESEFYKLQYFANNYEKMGDVFDREKALLKKRKADDAVSPEDLAQEAELMDQAEQAFAKMGDNFEDTKKIAKETGEAIVTATQKKVEPEVEITSKEVEESQKKIEQAEVVSINTTEEVEEYVSENETDDSWTEDENDFLMINYESRGVTFCSRKLFRSEKEVNTQWEKIKNKKQRPAVVEVSGDNKEVAQLKIANQQLIEANNLLAKVASENKRPGFFKRLFGGKDK